MAEINWEELERNAAELRALAEELEDDARAMIRAIRRKDLELFKEVRTDASIRVTDLRAIIDKFYRLVFSSDPLLRLLMRRR